MDLPWARRRRGSLIGRFRRAGRGTTWHIWLTCESPATFPIAIMSAYVIAIIKVTNATAYAEYARLAAPVNAQYNSTLLARSNQFEFLEGGLDCNRVVINRFNTIDDARAFYHSVEYQAAKAKRMGASDFNMLVVQGED